MQRIPLAVLAMLAVNACSPAWAQFTPPSASAPARPGQPADSGVNTRTTLNPTAPVDIRQTEEPNPRGPTKPSTTVPPSKMAKEACDKWRKEKKTEHEACVNS
jgi:hypothetical protein